MNLWITIILVGCCNFSSNDLRLHPGPFFGVDVSLDAKLEQNCVLKILIIFRAMPDYGALAIILAIEIFLTVA